MNRIIFWYNISMKLILHPKAEKRLKRGQHGLLEHDFLVQPELDKWVELYNQANQFIGQAYISKENKGYGWLVSSTKQAVTEKWFVKLFETAKSKRQAYFHSEQTTAFRLFNQDGDGFGGFTVDLYADYAVFSWYNSFVYGIKEVIISAFSQVYQELAGAYEKIRFKGLDYESAHLYGQEAPDTFTVLENGVRYQVFMNDGLMTGIFLDQHEVRGSLIDGLAAGKSLLNMFSYTAAFSIAAAMGGASQTTSVDLAKRSRELSQAHFEANGVDVDQHSFVVMDVFEYFKYAKRKGLTYDVIVIDPPSFARNKKQTFSVAKDYHKLVSQAVEILEPNGHLILSTNAANLSLEKFKDQIEKGFGAVKHRYVTTYRLPSDFVYNKKDESSNYLKVFTIQVKK